MNPIQYWFPMVYLDEEDPEENVVVQEQGRILPYRLESEPYEVNVEARGYRYHLIFGHQENGVFLCLPERDVGCGLYDLSDREQIMDALLRTERLDYGDSTVLTWALVSIGSLLRFIH